MKKTISFIFGTRPEAIKLCPLILAMRNHQELDPHVCVTGQHREMLDQVLEVFGVVPDADLALMQPDQTLGGLTSRATASIDLYLAETKPEMVLVQGDTTTVFCAALCAFYHKISVGHVEAGLRTGNKYSPFPEEINRMLATRLADLHFAPTSTSCHNLVKEGVPADKIFITGNTVIDALFIALEKVKANSPQIPGLPQHLMNGNPAAPLVLITGHRRENFGNGFENICRAIAELAQHFPETHFVYPVHLNPNVREPVQRILGSEARKRKSGGSIKTPNDNIHLIEPLSYLAFVTMMNRATLVLTDSGGVQEEAPSLGKPVLVTRDTTERPEAVEMGTVKLVGTDAEAIIENVSLLLTDPVAYESMANSVNPYGDGKAAERIIAACQQFMDAKKSNG
jgi:UDP-N-acetylglucosamine 2-epimerase (non-hydrolysing)